MRRKQVEFIPVVMIPEAERTPADLAAIEHLHTLHQEVMSTMDTERSAQIEIGISEIGSECRKCVARKLSLHYPPRREGGAGWRAQVGTMTHDYLERHFVHRYPWMFEYDVESKKWLTLPELNPEPNQPIYYLERRLQVFEYEAVVEGQPYRLNLGGSCDLFTRKLDAFGREVGIVSDWKVQGPDKLSKTGKGQIGATYHTQMNTYGFGYERAGFHPTHVDLHALPRDGHLDESRPVLMRYDRQMALDALARLANMIDLAAVFGWEELIAMTPRATPCWDCDYYEAHEESNFITSLTT